MSDDDQAVDEEIEEEVDTEEQPEIDQNEMADLSELADEVEDESGSGADDREVDENDGTDDDVDGDLATPDDPNATNGGETWGDLYVGTLTTVSNALIEEYGEETDKIEEDLARQQHLDEFFNDWMESRGKREDMPPEQALMLSTSIFLVTVLGTKTDLISQLLAEADVDL